MRSKAWAIGTVTLLALVAFVWLARGARHPVDRMLSPVTAGLAGPNADRPEITAARDAGIDELECSTPPTDSRVPARELTPALAAATDAGVQLRGRVVDDLGLPVERFRVRVHGEAWFGHRASRLIENSDGAFVFDELGPGAWLVRAEPLDRARSHSPALRVELPRSEEIELVVPRSGRLHGTVVGPSGEPIVGTQVFAWADESGVEAYFDDDIGDLELPDELPPLTDRAGRFELDGVPPGALTLSASADGMLDGVVAVELAPGAEVRGIVIELGLAAMLTGEIHPAAGPIAGRTVHMEELETGYTRVVRCDASGRFEQAGLAPGRCRLTLLPARSLAEGSPLDVLDMYQQWEAEVDLVAGSTVHVILGAPAEHPIRVHGRVTANGEPLASASVIWQGADVTTTVARAGDDGEYEVALERSGEWAVLVGDREEVFDLISTEVPTGESHRFDIDLSHGSLSGHVLGPGGRALAGVEITLSTDELSPAGFPRIPRQTTTDADGRYALSSVTPATYDVTAGGPESGDENADVHGLQRVRGVAVIAGEDARVDFVLRPAGTILGTLLLPSGEPVGDAPIDVLDANGEFLPHAYGITSEPTGSFRISGLSAGTVRVRAEGAEEMHVRVVEGETVRVELVVRR